MTNTSKIFGSSRPKRYWSQAIDPKLLGRIFWIMVKSWVASNLGLKFLGQRNILSQGLRSKQKFESAKNEGQKNGVKEMLWVNAKIWVSKKLKI